MNPAFWTDTKAALAYRAQPAQPTAESPPKIGNAPEGQSEARGNEPNDLQSSTPNAPVQSNRQADSGSNITELQDAGDDAKSGVVLVPKPRPPAGYGELRRNYVAWYIAQGLHPIRVHSVNDACNSPGKQPICAGWQKTAPDSPEAYGPEDLVGLKMGRQSDGRQLVAFDVDSTDWDAELSKISPPETWPNTLAAKTPKEGLHAVYEWPASVPLPSNAVKLPGTQIDLRSEGGQIVVAPSWHANGARSWIDPTAPIALLTEETARKVALCKTPLSMTSDAAMAVPPIQRNAISEGRFRRVVQRLAKTNKSTATAFERLLRGIPFAEPGDRDTMLFQMVGDLATEMPHAEPQSIAAHFSASLSFMGVDAAGAPTEADVVYKFTRALDKVRAETLAAQANRPEIVLGFEYRKDVDAVLALLAKREIFHRTHTLVEVCAEAPADGIRRPEGSSIVREIPLDKLWEMIDSSATFVRMTDMGPKRTHGPKNFANFVRARGTWPDVRPLTGFTSWPVIRPDGSILSEPGYDTDTGLLCDSTVEVNVPGQITREMAFSAREFLEDLAQDFPFVSAAHRSSWVAFVLTLVARHAVNGPCPMTIFEASTPSSGKSLLADLAGLITGGRPLARSGVSTDQEENRKAMLSIGIAADPVILFDNVKGHFRNVPLEAIITGGSFKDRKLGTNDYQSVPVNTVFCLTSNNCQLELDMVSRSLLCRLEPDSENPEKRTGFKYPQIQQHVLDRRADYLSAALAIVCGYFQAGCPKVSIAPTRHPAWASVVQSALVWAGGVDPVATQDELGAFAGAEKADLGGLLSAWYESLGSDCVTVKELAARLSGNKAPNLYTAIFELCDIKSPMATVTNKDIGELLRRYRGRVAGDYRLEATVDKHTKHNQWRVLKRKEQAA